MSEYTIRSDLTLNEIMERWPKSINVFIEHKMMCVGCPIVGFHTINDACREYDLDKEAFLEELSVATTS